MSLLPIWLIFSILAGFTSNAFNFLSRYVLREKEDPVGYLWYTELAKVVVFLPVALLFDWKFTLTSQAIFIVTLTGITQLAAGYFWVKMHEHSHLSISTILSRTRMIWVPILGFVFIGEKLQSVEYIAIAILFIGVSIISAPNKLFVDKGALYANICAFLTAINIIIVKLALDYTSNSVMIVFHALPSVLLLPLIMTNSIPRLKKTITKRFRIKTFAVLCNVLTFLFFAMAVRIGDVSKVNAIYQGMLFLSVLAGITFLKEREDIPRKLVGTCITVLGVALLSMS
jgi:drug/metabolite transporter (DMT)-like permease